jgi:peptidoglycan/xylan/chitin deacetylase (PgdA/CDA1 family)
MSLRSQLGNVHRNLLCAVYRRALSLGDRGPIVSFTFDDFPRSSCSIGAPILERFGARGTYYAAAGLANTSTDLGDLFVEDDVHSLIERGHEIASHTFRHSSCRSIPLLDFQADVREGMKAIELLSGSNSGNFAYPFGHVSLATKKMLAPHLRSARSIIPGINAPDVDLNLLRANSLYGDVDRSTPARELILQNVRRKGWLIFYTHDIRPNPSEYGCTPELFEFTVSQAIECGSRISTVESALSQIGNGSLAASSTASAASSFQ